MFRSTTRLIVDDYWAGDLGCRREELRPPSPRIQAHGGGLAGYPGVFILTLDGAPVVSVPPELVATLSPKAALFTAAAVAAPETLRHLLAPALVDRVIGPAYLDYADDESLRTPDLRDTRQLTPADQPVVDALKANCLAADWEPKGFDLQTRPSFGAFDSDGALVAIADFEVWGGHIAHFGLVADPGVRGRGHGTRAFAAAARSALDAGLVLQYRVLADNFPSLRVAAKLGFARYGWSVAARFACTLEATDGQVV